MFMWFPLCLTFHSRCPAFPLTPGLKRNTVATAVTESQLFAEPSGLGSVSPRVLLAHVVIPVQLTRCEVRTRVELLASLLSPPFPSPPNRVLNASEAVTHFSADLARQPSMLSVACSTSRRSHHHRTQGLVAIYRSLVT